MGILVQVQMRATKENLNGLPKEQMPKPSQVMKERGHLLIPIALLPVFFVGLFVLCLLVTAAFLLWTGATGLAASL